MLFRRRLFTLFSILAVLSLALVGAGCGGDSDNGGGGGGGGDDDAQALLKKSFAKKVDSADVDLDVKAQLKGGNASGPISLKMSGPYESQGKGKAPLLDWDISASAQGTTIKGGIIVTKDNAYVNFRDQNYEVGKQAFKQYTDQLAKQQADQPKSLTDLGVDPAGWLKDPKVSDGEEIGGDGTKQVSGDVDVEKIIKDVVKIAKSPAVKKQLESQGQSPSSIKEPSAKDIKQVEDAIEKLTLQVNVDDDDVLRKLLLDSTFKNPKPKGGDVESGTASLDITLDSVGEGADVKAPSGAKPITELLQQFGGLGGGGLGGGMTP